MLVHRQNFYDRHTGKEHMVMVLFDCVGSKKRYDVIVDDNRLSSVGTKYQAFDKIVDVIRFHNWSPVCPI